MPSKAITIRRWQLVASFVVLTASFTVGLYLVVHFNNDRIHDIQNSRVYSCKKTYRSAGELTESVALFFFPSPMDMTERQRAIASNLHLFIRGFVREKVAGCSKQTNRDER